MQRGNLLGTFPSVGLLVVFIFSVGIAACHNQESNKILPQKPEKLVFSDQVVGDMGAHWLAHDIVLLATPFKNPYLVASSDASFDNDGKIDSKYRLAKTQMPAWVAERQPHLQAFSAYTLQIDTDKIKTLLKQQLAIVDLADDSLSEKGALVEQYSYVQFPFLLDALYTSGKNDADEYQELGAQSKANTTEFALWAPTAKAVSVQLFSDDKSPAEMMPLTENSKTGIWQISTENAPMGTFYQYQLEVYHPSTLAIEVVNVTDPYSLSLSTNSLHSQVVDLNTELENRDLQPDGWQTHTIPTVNAPEEMVLYETHIRDFSALDNSLSDKNVAGKYAAFSEANSNAMKHLKSLKEAGLNVVHLLPTYDITTVNEDPEQVVYPSDTLTKVCRLAPNMDLCQSPFEPSATLQSVLENTKPTSAEAQAIIEPLRKLDPFNWGYDPFHYTVPEGSYALNPDGFSRIKEFRQMVMSLHELGFRVVMDVVYNHTFEAGLGKQSVLDKIVPNYYHRLHPITGAIEQSTCCDNTATEHRMMTKLMIDSLVVWARDYKIDGFRFDLMGHQPKAAMLEARKAVQAVDADTYFYGEGWNFGEVANNARFVQATQNEMAGTEIGTFTDRLRDAIRGGSSFVSGDDIRKGQGLGNGLVSIPNELQTPETQAQMMQEYLLSLDQARLGLVANLRDYQLLSAQGKQVTGADIDYGGSPSGYALDPADIINYVSKHDNQTLWDNNQYRIASHVSTHDRVRMQILSLAYPLMSQGIPFIHMGSELLRSKAFLRDSYDFGDWYNRVDFSKQSNNYLVGLPPADKDEANWDIITRVIEQNEGRDIVSPSDIEFASTVFKEFLKIRTSTPLFSLRTAEQIKERITFYNAGNKQNLGLIVMGIADNGAVDLDPDIAELLVIINHGPNTEEFKHASAKDFVLHPVQQNSKDDTIKKASVITNGFSIPGLSVAVFVK